MRLKSNHILPLLLLLSLFTSCSEDDDTAFSDKEIRFSSSSLAPVASRSSATETLPTDYKMWVAAIYHDQYNENHKYYFGASIEKKFAWDSELSLWKGIEDHYYPLSGTMDFLAYAIQKDEHKPTPTYTPATLAPGRSTFSTLTLDFGNKLDGTDPVVFSDLRSGVSCSNSSTTQSLQFRHPMSKIVFKACTDEGSTKAHFQINQITIRNVQTSGVLKITPLPSVLIGAQPTGSKSEWTSVTNLASISILPTSASVGVTTTAAEIGSPAYLPPQPDSPKDIEMELTYSYQPETGPAFGPEKITITLKEANWLPGQQYTYTLTCNLKQINVECESTGAILDSTPENIDLDEQYNGKDPV